MTILISCKTWFAATLMGGLFACAIVGITAGPGAAGVSTPTPIQPYAANPWYWEYHGKPILLRGGSDEDNLFQWTGRKLTDHLDLLTSVGGNYVRNTMSSRDPGNVYPFKRLDDGAYDLDQWDEEFWRRLTFFLEETARRGIIVQLTLWDQYDRGRNHDPWMASHNINYGAGVIDSGDSFYATVETGNTEGLQHQEHYIDRLLTTTLALDHVLYNIENESRKGRPWENHWAGFIHRIAAREGRTAYVTTMQFDASNAVRTAMSHRDLYNYVEVSQNNQDSRGGRGPGHWDNLMLWRPKLAGHALGPMPMNNEKVYGGLDGVNLSAGTETEAMHRFWRNIFAGCASSRFHRTALPRVWGSGLNERVQQNLRAMEAFLAEFNLFTASPHNDLLRHVVASAPSAMEAYALADIGRQYAVFFPRGRYLVDLDPWTYVNRVRVRWLNIDNLSWSKPEIVDVRWEGGHEDWGDRGRILLKTPGAESFVAVIDVVEPAQEPGSK
jgi:hypothetical protein